MKNKNITSHKRLLTILLFFFIGFTAEAQTYLISDGGTVNTCNGTLYDSGGATGDYYNNEDYTITVCSDMTGTPVELFFDMFDVESPSFDHLTIYDGPNTGSPVLVSQAGYSDIEGDTYTSSGDCLTLVWHTDGSVTYPGFEAEISCAVPCQDYTIDFLNISPPITNTDSMWIDVCPGTEIEFEVGGNYPNNDINYHQEDANITYHWTIDHGNDNVYDEEVQGMNVVSHVFDEPGGYYVYIEANDINGCEPDSLLFLRVRVAIPPYFNGTHIVEDSVCIGDPIHLNGAIVSNTWGMEVENEVAGVTFLPDGSGVSYSTSITNNVFSPAATVSDVDDIESICVNMEHSYMGDLDMEIECPNGQTMTIFDQGGGGTIMGEPVATNLPVDGNSSNTDPGIGYEYCWTPFSTNGPIDDANNHQYLSTYTDPNGNVSTGIDQLIPGDYEIDGSWTDLIGCPLNGSWTIHITDNLSADNGYIFSWQINFDASLIPNTLWEFENEHLLSDSYWTGNVIMDDEDGQANAVSDVSGDINYTFHAVDDFGCVHDTTLSVFVRPAGDPECCVTPVADVDPLTDEVCSDSYTFHTTLDSSVNTVEWSQISGPGTADFGGQENSTDPTVTVDTWGIYEFQLVEQNMSPACSDTAVVEIGFFLTPNAQFTTTFIPCYGDSTIVEYVGNATDTADFTWDFDGGTATGSGAGPYEVTWSGGGTFDISLSIDDNGCLADTVQTVLVPEELTYSLTVEDDPCYQSCNGWAQIDVLGGTLPYDYSWGANNLSENLCEGDYGITVTDANGCEVSEDFTITEPPELVITDTSYQHISCFDADDGEIHVTANGGTGMLNYNWSDGGSGPDRVDMPAGNYYLTVVDENNCTVNESFTLTQPDELLITISPDNAICEGQVMIVSGQAMGGTEPYVYYWDSGSGFSAGTNSLTVSPDTTTTYSVYVEDAHGCESPVQSMTLTVSPEMNLTLITEDNNCYQSCDGEARVIIDGGLDPFDFSWAADGSVYQNMCAGMYDVTVTDIIGCQVDTVFFIDEPPQMIGYIYAEPVSCYGYEDGLAWVEISGGTPGYSYLWPDGTTNDSVNVGVGVHEVTVTDAHNCRFTMDVEVEEPPLLQVQVNGGDRWICQTNSTQLSAQATGGTPFGGGQYNFHWDGTDGSTYNVHNPTVDPDSTTTYTVYVTDAHGCTSTSDEVKVNVYPDLVIENVSTSYDTVCPGDPAIIEVDASGGNGGPYTLTLQDGDVVPSPFTVYPEETTNYIITLHDACGSPVVKDSIEIIVMPEPPNNFVADKVEGCPPLVVKFTELNPDNNYSYSWDFGDSHFANIKNPLHVYENAGNYSVRLTVTSAFGCKHKEFVEDMIYVYPGPNANFYPEPEQVSALDPEINFVNLSEHADSSFWFFGDGDSSHFTSPRHIYEDIGEFEVMLVAENEEGCRDTAVKTILVQDEFTFYAPTAFTPNGDGKNDFFMVYGEGIDSNEFSLRVYDRWGEMVFETDKYDPDKPLETAWDGTLLGNRYKGDPLMKSGVYYWYCKFKDYTGIWHEKEGTVTLVR